MIRRQFAIRLLGSAILGSASANIARGAEPALAEAKPDVATDAKPEVPVSTVPPGRSVLVSMYSKRQDGARTASGERFSSQELTTAHRALPFGTMIRLTNPLNQQSVVVRVNDRGPFIKGRELDISLRAAQELGLATAAGLARLVMHVIAEGN